MKTQQACLCQEIVDAVMSQWDDKVKQGASASTLQESNTINGGEDDTPAKSLSIL